MPDAPFAIRIALICMLMLGVAACGANAGRCTLHKGYPLCGI